MPMTPLSGVRISWLIVARKSDLALLRRQRGVPGGREAAGRLADLGGHRGEGPAQGARLLVAALRKRGRVVPLRDGVGRVPEGHDRAADPRGEVEGRPDAQRRGAASPTMPVTMRSLAISRSTSADRPRCTAPTVWPRNRAGAAARSHARSSSTWVEVTVRADVRSRRSGSYSDERAARRVRDHHIDQRRVLADPLDGRCGRRPSRRGRSPGRRRSPPARRSPGRGRARHPAPGIPGVTGTSRT